MIILDVKHEVTGMTDEDRLIHNADLSNGNHSHHSKGALP
jgi:hypothetical protein